MTESPDPDAGAPSGVPDDEVAEETPLGVPEAEPDGEGEPGRGEGAMPGIPDEGEPPTGG